MKTWIIFYSFSDKFQHIRTKKQEIINIFFYYLDTVTVLSPPAEGSVCVCVCVCLCVCVCVCVSLDDIIFPVECICDYIQKILCLEILSHRGGSAFLFIAVSGSKNSLQALCIASAEDWELLIASACCISVRAIIQKPYTRIKETFMLKCHFLFLVYYLFLCCLPCFPSGNNKVHPYQIFFIWTLCEEYL